jgi:6-pyruvoyl tetrahydropterin synthase/QueD family protein
MRLMRELRCYPSGSVEDGDARNSWLGSPAGDAVEPFVVLRAVVDGPVDPVTGYVCRIQAIDSVLRHGAAALIARRCRSAGHAAPSAATLLREAFPLVAAIGSEGVALRSLTLATSPRLSFTMNDRSPHTVCMTQCFEFSAAHRLYCKTLSEEENRRLFGKCANPNGHGHNYQLEVTLEGVPDETDGRVEPLPSFQRAVKERVIDRFDHKHLNLDCPEFQSLNPTVEHIARVIWDLLDGAFDRARLAGVRVWETPKTFAECTETGEG